VNLDAVLKINAKVTGTESVDGLNRALGATSKAADGAKKSFTNVVDSSAWQGAAIAATAIGVGLIASTKAAIDFETSISQVRKVVDGLDSPDSLQEIRQEILQLSKEMPITAQGFAEIYAAAGATGVARGEIQAFAVDVAKMSIAFDMTAEQAGQAMGKMRASMGLSQKDVVLLADAMNLLDANGASAAKQLVDFALRSGAIGKQAGLSAVQTTAFGSAMIGAGIETEVAATSFNNMVKALSKGESITDRQVSALKRLGLASNIAADGERDMTAAVQRESNRRLEIIQDESDRQQNELRKRYRRQLQLLEDQWEDESDAYADSLNDQAEAQIKALQRQADAQIKALQSQSEGNEAAVDAQIQLIRDNLEDQVDAIRDGTDKQLKVQQRAERDKRQLIKDEMDERMKEEAEALEKINQQRIEAEKAGTKEALEAAKAIADAGGAEAGKALAKRLQDDALGTIRDVFKKISELAPEERISVISDLFGDEARGLTPLINNLGALEKALGLVGDESAYAGSMTKEYNVQAGTTANQLQLLMNAITPLQIAIGESLVPALSKTVELLTPLINGMTAFAQTNPAITALVTTVAALGTAFVFLAPFIASTISVLGSLGITVTGVTAAAGSFAATIAGWAGIIAPAIAAIQSAIAAVAAFVAGLVTAPVLVTVAIVAVTAAVIAGVVIWRDEIAGFFTWLFDTAMAGWAALLEPLQPVIDSIIGIWNEVMGVIGGIYVQLGQMFFDRYIAPIQSAWAAFVTLFSSGWNTLVGVVGGIYSTLGQLFFDRYIAPAQGAWQGFATLLTNGWNTLSSLVSGIYSSLGRLFFQLYIEPIQGAWQGFVTLFSSGWNALSSLVSGIYSTLGRLFFQLYIEPAQASWNSFATLLTNGWNGLVTTATGAWTAIVNFIVPLFQQLGTAYNTALIQPIVTGTKAVLEFLATGFSALVTTLSTLFTRLATTFDTVVVKPFTQAWTTISNAARVGLNSILTTAKQVWDAIYKAFDAVIVKPIDKAWKAIAEGAKAVIRSMVKFAVDGINAAIGALQAVVDTVNIVRAAAGMSPLSKPAPIPMPKFARGGYVTGPTVGLVGEAGNEYIVPEAKAAGFASNIMAGQRGAAAIPSGSSSGGGGGAPMIQITTGPIRQDSTGQQWMTLEDGERMVREAVTQMQRTSRTPAGRYYSGVR
jgi:TP901 family phage tail tape measure protein